MVTNLYSIQCGIGLPLLHLTLRDVLDNLKDEKINIFTEPYLFDVFKPIIAKESTRIGLEALQGVANDGIAINIYPRELLKSYNGVIAKHVINIAKSTTTDGNPEVTIPIKPPRGTNTKYIKRWGQDQWNTRWKG